MTKKFTMQILAVLAITLSAAAQSDSLRALYDRSATIKTNMEGIRAYPAPPAGFDPIAASDEELAAYGIPLRPDKVQEPANYSQWMRVARLAANPHNRWNGEIKPRKVHSSLAVATTAPVAKSITENTASSATQLGWSGAVNTLPLATWSNTRSFSTVSAWFNVPYAQEAFADGGGNICDGGTDEAAFWVGMGGFNVLAANLGNQNNLAQTGVDITTTCGFDDSAYAWVEWNTGGTTGTGGELFGVNTGDDILVVVQANSPTSASYFIFDVTAQQTAGYVINPPSGFQLVGNEAEFIVERPYGNANNPATHLFQLANYVWSFWDFAHARTLSGVDYYPGSNSSATFRVQMVDDSVDQVISVPNFDKGGQNMFVSDENCAYIGGCS